MAAGQGFKTFVTGEVLTAGDVNGYLMQGINVFASTAARDAAITAPAEGQFAFTKDTNGLWYYDGAAWVASGATGDIEGVTAGIGISGGGTSGTVTITNSMATAIDAKGDLVAGTGADTFSRLAVGANDTVLTADSTAATGIKWATVSAGGMTLLSTTTLSGASVTVSSISQSYVNLQFQLTNIDLSTTSGVRLRFNGSSSSVYGSAYVGGANSFFSNSATSIVLNDNYVYIAGADSNQVISGTIYNYTNTRHNVQYNAFVHDNANEWRASTGGGGGNVSAAITSLTFFPNAGNFNAGTLKIWGVK